jgi:hypothetical protein
MRIRKASIVALAVGFAVLLTGCRLVFKTPPTGEQIDRKPKVAVELTICVEPEADCPEGEGSEPTSSDEGRVLIAFRVPKGSELPDEFSSTSGEAVNEVAHNAYSRQLNKKAPRRANYRWFGFRSDEVIPYTPGAQQEATFRVRIRIPDELRVTPFKVLPVVGHEFGTGRVRCGSSVFSSEGGPETNSLCISDPPEDRMKNIKVEIRD